MATMLRTVSTITFLCASAFAAFGQPLPSSSEGFHSKVRLISGGREGDHFLAGVEIVLDPGFKTYWRNPGESGLPPRFDWSGSENAESIEMKWPAPSRYEDASGTTYAYGGRLVLPVRVKAATADEPVELALSVDYGICKDICIPAHADLSMVLSGDGPDRAAIEQALAKVPHPQPLGAQADLSILSAEPAGLDAGQAPAIAVTVRAPAGTKPVLFAEAPDNWYVSTSPPDGSNRFTVTVEEKPRDAGASVPLRLTLVAGDKAIETEVALDGDLASR